MLNVNPIGITILFASFLCLTFKGIIFIKTKTVKNPFNIRHSIKDGKAVLVGALTIAFGLLFLSCLFLIIML